MMRVSFVALGAVLFASQLVGLDVASASTATTDLKSQSEVVVVRSTKAKHKKHKKHKKMAVKAKAPTDTKAVDDKGAKKVKTEKTDPKTTADVKKTDPKKPETKKPDAKK